MALAIITKNTTPPPPPFVISREIFPRLLPTPPPPPSPFPEKMGICIKPWSQIPLRTPYERFLTIYATVKNRSYGVRKGICDQGFMHAARGPASFIRLAGAGGGRGDCSPCSSPPSIHIHFCLEKLKYDMKYKD